MAIELMDGPQRKPMIICPHCKMEIMVDITAFKDNVAQIMADNCVKCGGKIYMGVILLAHPSPQGLAHVINAAVQAIQTQNKIIGGRRFDA